VGRECQCDGREIEEQFPHNPNFNQGLARARTELANIYGFISDFMWRTPRLPCQCGKTGRIASGKPLPQPKGTLMIDRIRADLSFHQAALSIRQQRQEVLDRKSTRLNSSHVKISYAVFCLK